MRAHLYATAAIALAVFTACAPTETKPAPTAEKPAATETAKANRQITLPVSINATMVALVDHASEPLWLDAYQPPKDEHGWQHAEHYAYQMALGGKLIQLAGTGPNDQNWVSDPEWIRMADELSSAGMDALAATKVRNADQLNAAGDRLVAACEACHKKFKPELPSMGLYKSSDYPVPERAAPEHK